MINLEGIAHKLTSSLYDGTALTEVEKAKIEYGLSLTLGVSLALLFALVLAYFLRTIPQTLILTLSALSLRIVSGGAHCSSYDRCLLFSLLIYVPSALLVKFLAELNNIVVASLYFAMVAAVLVYLSLKQIKAAVLVFVANGMGAGLVYGLKGSFLPGPMLAMGTGFFIQAALLTKLGQRLVNKADQGLKLLRI